MRKSRSILGIMAVVLILLSGCAVRQQTTDGAVGGGQTEPMGLTRPPELTVHCGRQSVPAVLGSYEWTRPSADGEAETVIACGLHPLEMEGLSVLVPMSRDDEVRLEFVLPSGFDGAWREADELTVTAWYEDETLPVEGVDDDMPASMDVELTEDGFQLVEGADVYCIDAGWEGYGSAVYCVRVAEWPLDLVTDGCIDAADGQQAVALGYTGEEFGAALAAVYSLTEGERQRLLAGETAVMCGTPGGLMDAAPGGE